MKIIIGLGNPGEQYKNTRHNVGFMVLDAIIEKIGLNWEMNKKFNALICRSNKIIYVKPQTFMNNSGRSVQAILKYYKLIPQSTLSLFLKESLRKTKQGVDLSEILTVIHDDIDIELGKIKESYGSRSAGHNGVQSIINYLKTKNFKRVRIGVKTEKLKHITSSKFVLEKFNQSESKIINKVITNIVFSFKENIIEDYI